VIFKTNLSIQRLGFGVFAFNFKMKGLNSERTTGIFHKLKRFCTDSLPTIAISDVEFINKGISPTKLQAVA